MKRIFGIALMLLVTSAFIFGQGADNNTYTDNTILSGTSDDIYYSQDNNTSTPPQSSVTLNNPNYQPNTNIGPGNSDNNTGAIDHSLPPSGNVAYDNPNPDNNNAYAYNNTDNNNPPVYNNEDNQNSADMNPDNQPAPTYQSFHDQLSPYGRWVSVAGYGNVWQPGGVTADFSPYVTAGHWVYTEYGWTWVSDYAWGGATFHYGRWFRDAAYGWLWAPGYQWAPAWVAWGSCGGYYCWAPLAPGFGFGYYHPAFAYWNFVPRGYIGYGRIGNYLVDRGRVFAGGVAHIGLINQAGSFRNGRFFAGPRAEEVEHYSGQHINRYSMATVNHATAAHFSTQAQVNHSNNNVYHAQANNYNHNTAPVNRNAAANNQQYRGAQQTNHYNTAVQQHYATQQNAQHPNVNAQAHNNYSRQQPVQQNNNHNFASAQHSISAHYSAPSRGGGNSYHGGGSSGGSRGGGGGHGRR